MENSTRASPLISVVATFVARGTLRLDDLRDPEYTIDLFADAMLLLDPHAGGLELGESITAKLLSSDAGKSVYSATWTYFDQHCRNQLATQLWMHAASPTPTAHWEPLLTSSWFGRTAHGLRQHQQRAGYGDVVERVSAALLTPLNSVRTYEVHGVSDWLRLLHASAETGNVRLDSGHTASVPDFQSLDDRWDAIHLSLAGFAALGGTYVEYRGGVTTAWPFEGEGTLWIAPLFAANPIALDPTDQQATDRRFFTDQPWRELENDQPPKPLSAVNRSRRSIRLPRRSG